MKIAFSKGLEPSDLWVFPFWEGPKEAALFPIEMGGAVADFQGKSGEATCRYFQGQRILLLGLGKQEEASVEALRRGFAAAIKAARALKAKQIHLLFPKCKQKQEFFQGIVEGLLLTNYSFSYKTDQKEEPLIERATFVGIEKSKRLEKIEAVIDGVHFVRDLINANADGKLELLLKAIHALPSPIKRTIFDKKRLEKEGMGLILAVSRGSEVEPKLVHLSYVGNPKSKKKIVLIGKGVLYDTGGLSLKPTDNMLSMKCDMGGAATVLGTLKAAVQLKLKVNVDLLLPLTENCIDGKSYKLGDVYTSYLGKTVEITNTDAEGRLILADAIGFAAKQLQPSAIVDMATLTGACVVALGDDYAGLFSNDDPLAVSLLDAAEKADELLWRLPVHGDYKESLKSDIADIVNSSGREAGAIKAALFLQEFTEKIPWAHIDIAGPAYVPKPKHYNPIKGTGYGVRLLVEFLEGLQL